MNHKLESKILGKISITSDDEELKSLLMRLKEESDKSWLFTQHFFSFLNIQKMKIVASSPISSV